MSVADTSPLPEPTIATTAAGPVPRWERFIAVGDSFTEGLWDTPEGPNGPVRGWADVLATLLSARRVEAGLTPLKYANLAVRGKLLRPILTQQVPAALEMKPDLVSVIGGGNDLLRPGADPDQLARNLEASVARIRSTGADVLMSTGFDTGDSPIISATRSKTGVYNAHIWSIARRQGAYVLDMWGMNHLKDWRMWDADRIHMTTAAHARVAQGGLVALGLTPTDEDWDAPLGAMPAVSRREQARLDADWLRLYAYPWVTRRLRGTSSGDHRTAKLPTLTEV